MPIVSITVTMNSQVATPTSVVLGIAGPRGPQGFQGATGAQGATGSQGSQGFQGTQGSQGVQGSTGSQGSQGSQGTQGTQGAQGADGPQGDSGAQGVQGSQGATGASGNTVFTGTGAPSDSLGVDGDTYVDVTNGDLYTHGGSTGWNYSGNIRGPQGLTGSQGIQGSAGADGTQGLQGAQGAQGASGSGSSSSVDIIVDGVVVATAVPAIELVGSQFNVSINSDGSAHISSKMKLNITNAQSGQVLWYNGGAWTNRTKKRAMVKKTSDETAANYTTATAIPWATPIYDNCNSFSAANPTRVSIPAGVTTVEVFAHIRIASLLGSTAALVTLAKNGNTTYDGVAAQYSQITGTTQEITVRSGPLEVVGGTDYFECYLFTAADTSIDLTATRCHFGWKEVD